MMKFSCKFTEKNKKTPCVYMLVLYAMQCKHKRDCDVATKHIFTENRHL